jgi:hypothetical protein
MKVPAISISTTPARTRADVNGGGVSPCDCCAVAGHPAAGWLITKDGALVVLPHGELLADDRGYALDLAEQSVDMELAEK